MTACIGKTVVSVIFVAAADVNVFVPVAFFILVQLFVPVIIRQYVRCFQSLHMSVTDVRKRELVHWKNGFTLLHMPKRNTRQFVLNRDKAYK